MNRLVLKILLFFAAVAIIYAFQQDIEVSFFYAAGLFTGLLWGEI